MELALYIVQQTLVSSGMMLQILYLKLETLFLNVISMQMQLTSLVLFTNKSIRPSIDDQNPRPVNVAMPPQICDPEVYSSKVSSTLISGADSVR